MLFDLRELAKITQLRTSLPKLPSNRSKTVRFRRALGRLIGFEGLKKSFVRSHVFFNGSCTETPDKSDQTGGVPLSTDLWVTPGVDDCGVQIVPFLCGCRGTWRRPPRSQVGQVTTTLTVFPKDSEGKQKRGAQQIAFTAAWGWAGLGGVGWG